MTAVVFNGIQFYVKDKRAGLFKMRARNAAALALAGWCLMTPPGTDASKPLSEYTVDSLENLKDCSAVVPRMKTPEFEARVK